MECDCIRPGARHRLSTFEASLFFANTPPPPAPKGQSCKTSMYFCVKLICTRMLATVTLPKVLPGCAMSPGTMLKAILSG